MRSIIFVSLLIFSLGCASTKSAKNSFALDGEWIPIHQEFGGNELPPASFAQQRLIMKDSSYNVLAESADKGIARYSNNKMDIFGKDGPNAGKHYPAIYKLENNQLTICYNLKGNGYPEAFDTKGKPLFFLSVYTMKK
jgi:uncharacterized protein (TIGR03067 family)